MYIDAIWYVFNSVIGPDQLTRILEHMLGEVYEIVLCASRYMHDTLLSSPSKKFG